MSAKNRVSAPRLSYLASVHPRLYFCRDAALMRLSGGLDRLVYACPDADEDGDKPKETYGVYLNGVPLVNARIPDCSTCGPFLSKGYGDGLIREEECILISPQKLENIPWGRLSDKYPTERFMDFPPEGQPTLDCVPPPDRIRSLIAEEMKKGRGNHNMRVIEQLRRYAKMFPESKWLSASERAWLDRDYYEFRSFED